MRFRFADCVLDAERFELLRGGRPVAVQPKVLELLLFLVRNHERAVGKGELLDAVWKDTATGESSLTRAVSFARAALGEREKDARVIRTVRGRGYRIGVPVALEHRAAPAAPGAANAGFFGRERELAVGDAALEDALAGRGRLLLVAGEPGIGKTRLARELAERARERGAEALWGRCHEDEHERAYWPFAQLLREGLASGDGDAVHRALGDAAAEVAELVPELRDRLPELPPPEADPERARARRFDAVAKLLASRATSRPLLLVLDDLHAADGPSLRLLRFLAPQLTALRVLLVVTHRELGRAAPRPFAETLAELSRLHPPARTLRLRGLERSAVERLIEHELGSAPPPALVEACHGRSEGNPLFVRELLHGLEGPPDALPAGFARELPDGIRYVMRRRLATLSDGCRAVLACASVLGREFSVELVAHASGLPGPEVLARLEEAEAAQVIEPLSESVGGFRFAHPLFAETLRDGLGSATRARLHARIAEALEERLRPRAIAKTDLAVPIRAGHLAELAHHFYAALPLVDAAKALDYCERAGTHALSVLALAEAERHLERALRVLEAHAPADAERRDRLLAGLAGVRGRARAE